MKKLLLACVFAGVWKSPSFDFRRANHQQSMITGKISPRDAADFALIIRGKDTLRTPLVSGNFFQQVKPGKYTLIVLARNPFKNVMIRNLEVKHGRNLDIGELLLEK
jgi:hypothetical protein